MNSGFANIKSSVARWYIFIPKMPTLAHFGRPWDGNFDVFHGLLVFLLIFWTILWPFGIL
jgi:hypothetical protein